MVAEAIFATATAMVISAVDEELCRRLLGEVRKSVSVSLTGVNGPNAEWLKLHAEEQAERLLDQIQRFAEFQRKSQQLGTEPT